LSVDYSQSLRDLVDKCLNTDPESRPNIEEVLRYPLVRTELDNILNDLVPLTYDYSTAMSTHLVLEQVIEIQCMLAKSTDDYGFTVTDPSLLRVANTPNTQFLLQAELRAIHNGLEFKEKQVKDGTYKGYEDKDGQQEGVGIYITSDGHKYYGEYHINKLHGCGKVEYADGGSYWGEYKDCKAEGYGTFEGANGDRYIG
jgi:serine/threonine protein kinase